MFRDLLDYEEVQEACAELFGFSGVTFKRNFGPLKQGETYYTVWFDLETGQCQVYDADNVKTHEFNFTLESELK